ncbi:17468_t:CDS:1, partial [Entrophospora sp. SA101]
RVTAILSIQDVTCPVECTGGTCCTDINYYCCNDDLGGCCEIGTECTTDSYTCT